MEGRYGVYLHDTAAAPRHQGGRESLDKASLFASAVLPAPPGRGQRQAFGMPGFHPATR